MVSEMGTFLTVSGGYENSSRVFGARGFDDPGLRTAARVLGCTGPPPDAATAAAALCV